MTNWQPTEKQNLFMKLLKENPDGLTLHDAERLSETAIASGSINALITKKMVETDDIVIECNIVAVETGEILGHTKKKVKRYRLVQTD